MRGEIAELRGELRGEMTAMEERLEGKIALVLGEIGAMESRLRGEMGAMEARLMRWGAVGLLTVIAVNLAMMGVMFNLLQP